MKNLSAFLFLLILSSGLFAEAAEDPSPSDVNYAFGVLLGQSLASTGLDFDFTILLSGIKDSLGKGAAVRMNAEEAKQIVSAALQAAQDKLNQVKIAEENVWLDKHKQKKGVLTTASGLQYEVLKSGTGTKPVLTDVVKVNYVGTLVDGTTFDSSIDRGEPAVFPLDQVIPAWTEGIQLMGVGSKFRFTIPSNLAYGAQGAGDIIPPFSTLVFEVELLSIEPPAQEPPAQ